MQRGAACPETVNKAFAKRQKMDHSVVCNPYRENRPKPVKLLHTGAVDRSPPRGCATLRQSGMTPPPHLMPVSGFGYLLGYTRGVVR